MSACVTSLLNNVPTDKSNKVLERHAEPYPDCTSNSSPYFSDFISTSTHLPSPISVALASWLYTCQASHGISFRYQLKCHQSETFLTSYLQMKHSHFPPAYPICIHTSSFSIALVKQLIYFINVLIYCLRPFPFECKFHGGGRDIFSVSFTANILSNKNTASFKYCMA